jgi:hypothetical protein
MLYVHKARMCVTVPIELRAAFWKARRYVKSSEFFTHVLQKFNIGTGEFSDRIDLEDPRTFGLLYAFISNR